MALTNEVLDSFFNPKSQKSLATTTQNTVNPLNKYFPEKYKKYRVFDNPPENNSVVTQTQDKAETNVRQTQDKAETKLRTNVGQKIDFRTTIRGAVVSETGQILSWNLKFSTEPELVQSRDLSPLNPIKAKGDNLSPLLNRPAASTAAPSPVSSRVSGSSLGPQKLQGSSPAKK